MISRLLHLMCSQNENETIEILYWIAFYQQLILFNPKIILKISLITTKQMKWFLLLWTISFWETEMLRG